MLSFSSMLYAVFSSPVELSHTSVLTAVTWTLFSVLLIALSHTSVLTAVTWTLFSVLLLSFRALRSHCRDFDAVFSSLWQHQKDAT